MTRRLNGLILASALLLASVSAYARPGGCDLQCFCYSAGYVDGRCGTISDSGCAVISCI